MNEQRPPYFPFWVDDFLADDNVGAMNTEEIGAYLLLLLRAWKQTPVASIPNDDDTLCRWCKLSAKKWERVRINILVCWELRDDGRLYQKRMEREFTILLERAEKASENGKKGNKIRWDRKRIGIATRSPPDRHPIATASLDDRYDHRKPVATPSHPELDLDIKANSRARIGIGDAAAKRLLSEIPRDRNGNPIPQQQLDALK